MTIKEHLIKYKNTYDTNKRIELRDILNDGIVYCGGGYNQLMESLSEEGLNHVANARYICKDIEAENNCIVLYYLKSAEYYPQYLLQHIVDNLKDKEF